MSVVPAAISKVDGLVSLSLDGPKVYFLCHQGEVVYVGKTTRPIEHRLSSHAGQKMWDSVYAIPVQEADIDSVEQRYIRELHPRFNIQWNGAHRRPSGPRQTRIKNSGPGVIKCDYCDSPATSLDAPAVYWREVTEGKADALWSLTCQSCYDARGACAYWIPISDLQKPKQRVSWYRHLMGKGWFRSAALLPVLEKHWPLMGER